MGQSTTKVIKRRYAGLTAPAMDLSSLGEEAPSLRPNALFLCAFQVRALGLLVLVSGLRRHAWTVRWLALAAASLVLVAMTLTGVAIEVATARVQATPVGSNAQGRKEANGAK